MNSTPKPGSSYMPTEETEIAGNPLHQPSLAKAICAIALVLEIHSRRPRFAAWNSASIRKQFPKHVEAGYVDESILEWFLGRFRERWFIARNDDALYESIPGELECWAHNEHIAINPPIVVADPEGIRCELNTIGRLIDDHPKVAERCGEVPDGLSFLDRCLPEEHRVPQEYDGNKRRLVRIEFLKNFLKPQ